MPSGDPSTRGILTKVRAEWKPPYCRRERDANRWNDGAGWADARWHGLAIERFDAWQRLGRIAMPTLVVHGTEDPIMPIDNGRRLAAAIDGARFVSLANVGHLPAVERPAETAGLILELLS